MSLSSSHCNLTLVLALADGCALSVESAYRRENRSPKTILELCAKLHAAIEDALDTWGIEITSQRTMDALHRRLARFEEATLSEPGSIEVPLSVVLALLEPAIDAVRDPVKRAMLERVESCVFRIIRYFDKDLRHWQCYQRANECLKVWFELERNA